MPPLFLLFALSIPTTSNFDSLIQQSKSALREKDHRKARSFCAKAKKHTEEPAEGGPKSFAAHMLCGDIEMKAERYLTAAKHYKRAGHLSVFDRRMRKRALQARRLAARKANNKNLVDWVTKLLAADRQLYRADRGHRMKGMLLKTVLDQTQKAQATYKADKDWVSAQWAVAARGLVMVKSEQVEEGLKLVDRVLKRKSAPTVAKIAAYDAIQYGRSDQTELPQVVHAAIWFNHLRNKRFTERQRRYRRARRLDIVCKKYDQVHGAGACAKLELEQTGELTLRNFSVGKKKPRLGQEDIANVHRGGLPAIEDCVLTAARKDKEYYRGANLQISWVILPTGRASEMEISPKRYAKDLKPCVEQRLAWLRYPLVRSQERQNVSVPYRLD